MHLCRVHIQHTDKGSDYNCVTVQQWWLLLLCPPGLDVVVHLYCLRLHTDVLGDI